MKKYSSNNFLFIVAIGLLAADQTFQQEVAPILKHGQIIDPQDGFITKFISHGFDLTKINLFGDLSLENLKDSLFEHKPVKNATICSSDDLYCYTLQESFVEITPVELNRTETTVYKLEKALHPLLNANVSDQTAGNYSYQLFESSYYGRVSAESIYYQSYWKVTLEIGETLFEYILKQQFKDDVKNLAGKNMSDYFKFIEKYGTHYFPEVTYGGMYRMEGKASGRFVDDVSEAGYKMYLEKNLERAIDVNDTGDYSSIPLSFYYHNHYKNFTYGGDDKIKISNQSDFKNWQKTIEAKIVPIGWKKDTIYNLIKMGSDSMQIDTTEQVKNLKLVTETIETKFKIQSYLDGLEVIQNNLYGHGMAGHFNPFTLQAYFDEKIKEPSPVLDTEFWENCWCTDHDAESILNRRDWFPKPTHTTTTTVETPISELVVSQVNLRLNPKK